MIKFLKFVPVQLTFFLIFGILVGKHFPFSVDFVAEILLFLILLFGIVYYSSKNKISTISFAFLFFAITIFIGIASITFQKDKNKTNYFGNVFEFSKSSNPTAYLQITKTLKDTKYYNKFEAAVIQLNKTKTSGKILVNIQKDSINNTLELDDVLLTKVKFKAILKPKNPYTFNYKKYLENKQIFYQLTLSKKQYKKLPKQRITLNGFAFFIRKEINKSLQKNGFKNEVLAVINALLLGQRNFVSSDLLKSYAGAGAIHILAVSGLHIGILLWLLTWLFKPLHYLKNGKTIALISVVILLWMYAVIAGLSASVVRAVAMFTAIAISLNVNRLSNIYNALVISMFFLLLFHPFYLFDVGFQLSYLAVFSIVWIQPKLVDLIKPSYWILNKLWQLFTVSIAAQIGILPLSIYYFHQFPGLFFVANLIIIPFLGIILIAGIIVILLSIFNILPNFIAEIYNFIINFMNEIVAFIANQHQFLIQNISITFWMMIAVYIFILVFFKFFEKQNFKRVVLVLSSIILIQSIFIFQKYKLQTTNELIVFNKTKVSIIGIRSGEDFKIYTSNNKIDKYSEPIKSYLIGNGIYNVVISNQQRKLLAFNKINFLRIDSLSLYPVKLKKPVAIILQKSPKINLERLLKTMHPTLIIADGSNFKSYMVNWKNTCIKNKTPFYSTMQKGAYKIVD
ncbi:MAG: ComEC/Rec2 family competence protein [Lutibacter sp.]|uniref:ComEC/Rec2 family competence protein n=1 Tax=Lutibacter sp. TaxID=1925666 RepID=UPI00299E34E9|nr:ComEC/Rec2 family competence protein [Lutibacter sp.]MDX1828941.1 ComEC/Rec2 family competence protein [Lutibacter sp.]